MPRRDRREIDEQNLPPSSNLEHHRPRYVPPLAQTRSANDSRPGQLESPTQPPVRALWQAIGQHAKAGALGGARALVRLLPERAQDWVDRLYMAALGFERDSLVDEAELSRVFELALATLRRTEPHAAIGDYLEFGVYRGASIGCMHRVLENAGLSKARLIGFDSFEGLPPNAQDEDDGHWRAGQFKSTWSRFGSASRNRA